MTINTYLYINPKWSIEDVVTVMKKHLGIKKVKIISCVKTSSDMFQLHFDYLTPRMMYIHLQAETPIGICTCMSLGSDAEAIKIMQKIANVIGGILNKRDSDGMYEFIDGKLSESDALPYFIRYAILNNEADKKDIVALNESIHKWHDEVKGASRADMTLYPRESRR